MRESQGRKKSLFPALTSIPSGATLDFVADGVNYKIALSDYLAALNVIGTISQAGDPNATPVLDQHGEQNLIRNLSDGSGVSSSVDAQNGIKLEHNFTQDSNGIAIFRNTTGLQPVFASLFEGDGIDITEDGDQLTISVTGTQAASKLVTVNQVSDFPAPVSGVITLEPDTTYQIANTITTGNRFVLQSGTSVIGISPLTALFTYTGTGVMFTGANGNTFMQNLLITAPNASQFISFNDTVAGTSNIRMDLTLVLSCTKFGTFSNVNAVSMTSVSVLSCDDGLTFAGSDWQALALRRVSMATANSSFVGVDLGNMVSPVLELTDLILEGPTGAIGISGLSNSGNIPTGELGQILSCNFVGDITPESGLDAANDIRWQTLGNDEIRDTVPDVLASLSGNTTETVISTQDVPVKAAGTWVCQRESLFSCDSTGRVTYLGERPFIAPIDCTVSLLGASGGDKQVSAYLAINGAVITETRTQVTMNSSKAGSGTCIWQYELQENDYVELFVENNDDTTNIEVNGVLRVN